nr:MAG TPA: hypothetical protein [Caudoviricetes sp.]
MLGSPTGIISSEASKIYPSKRRRYNKSFCNDLWCASSIR